MLRRMSISAFLFGSLWLFIVLIFFSIKGEEINLSIIIKFFSIGILVASIFTILIYFIQKELAKKIKIRNLNQEGVLKEEVASFIKGNDAGIGKLVLTDSRLIFQSHVFSNADQLYDFDLTNIENLRLDNSSGYNTKGFSIETIYFGEIKFVVKDPQDWVGAILKQKLIIKNWWTNYSAEMERRDSIHK